jgi:small-conductance mechanosensitive channel
LKDKLAVAEVRATTQEAHANFYYNQMKLAQDTANELKKENALLRQQRDHLVGMEERIRMESNRLRSELADARQQLNTWEALHGQNCIKPEHKGHFTKVETQTIDTPASNLCTNCCNGNYIMINDNAAKCSFCGHLFTF